MADNAADHDSLLTSNNGTSVLFVDPNVSLQIQTGPANGGDSAAGAININGLDSTRSTPVSSIDGGKPKTLRSAARSMSVTATCRSMPVRLKSTDH